jgi:hypothetical protein
MMPLIEGFLILDVIPPWKEISSEIIKKTQPAIYEQVEF